MSKEGSKEYKSKRKRKPTPVESVAMVWSVINGLLLPFSSLFDIERGYCEQNIDALAKKVHILTKL